MGWSFRRSIRIGPLRFNLSKSGIGASAGIPGLRVGKDAKGRNYSQVSIPGTGIYRATSEPKQRRVILLEMRKLLEQADDLVQELQRKIPSK